MDLDNIKSPEELYQYMDNNIKYGLTIDNKVYEWDLNGEFQYICQTKWRLQSSDELIKTGYGHCWDQVELERDWFQINNYEYKTFFICFLFDYDNTYPTHSYLIYKDKTKNRYYYFEHADSNNKGIFEFDSYEEAIKYQLEKYLKNVRKNNIVNKEELMHLHIYEFDKPKTNINQKEYLNHILSSLDITDRIMI